jgi:hypothetical protein
VVAAAIASPAGKYFLTPQTNAWALVETAIIRRTFANAHSVKIVGPPFPGQIPGSILNNARGRKQLCARFAQERN